MIKIFNSKPLIFVLFVFALTLIFIGQKQFSFSEAFTKIRSAFLNSDQLKITEELAGDGPAVKKGDEVVIDYEANTHGQKFDSTHDRHEPVSFTVGNGQVIAGLEKAVIGMKQGGRRHVIIPSHLGYGKTGAGDGLVPANASLEYVIELRELNP